MVLIDFYDRDLMNTLVPIKSLQPDKVFFLLDGAKESDQEIRFMAEAIYAWGTVQEIYCYLVDISSYSDIGERLDEIMDKVTGEAVYMEFSG